MVKIQNFYQGSSSKRSAARIRCLCLGLEHWLHTGEKLIINNRIKRANFFQEYWISKSVVKTIVPCQDTAFGAKWGEFGLT